MKKQIIAFAVAFLSSHLALADDCSIMTTEGTAGDYSKVLKTVSVQPDESVMYVISDDRSQAILLDFENINYDELKKYQGQKVVAFYRGSEEDTTNSIAMATIQVPSEQEPDADWFTDTIIAAGEWDNLVFLANSKEQLAAACKDGSYPN